MGVRQLIPEDLADIPPGPELARVLAGLELSRLSGFDCVEVLKAQYRQANHERARVMAAMAEVGVCGLAPDDDLTRMATPDEFSADEVRVALVLTRRAAQAQFWLAHDLVTRLPQVHAAMDAGVLDEPRARVFSEWTTELSPEQAQAVCAALLPKAPTLTTGQLIEQIKKLAIAVAPDWARRRYEQAIADRKVVGYRNSDGSANLSGYNLPLDRVAAASGHIDALAKAVKRAGDSRPIDHIRADLFLGMTDGTYTGLDDAAIIEFLTAAVDSDVDQPDSDSGEGGDPTTTDGSAPNDTGLHCGGDEAGDSRPSASGDEPTRLVRAAVGAGLELRVRLSTLLGHDQYPAELAGWGYLHAELARDLTTTLGGAQWRFAITDERGHLIHCGITRVRPTGTPTRSTTCRAIVELQVPADALRALAVDPTALGGWAGVVADLTSQLDDDILGRSGNCADAPRRVPGAALRRYLEIRDRYCTMIGCRAPAHTADKDHTVDHAKGGPTTDPNLGDACRHDHRLKSEGGWALHQSHPGVFHWTSRLGHTYHRPPPAIIEPLPDPIPRDRPPYPIKIPTDDGWEDTSIWEDPPVEPEPDPKPDPPPKPDPRGDVPPF
ncbi:MAG: HNH endonuclease [Actinomycetota bacterium]|nr:HNH endonuclease [Actinomycetota bacterium]